jgi:hypothetical protein
MKQNGETKVQWTTGDITKTSASAASLTNILDEMRGDLLWPGLPDSVHTAEKCMAAMKKNITHPLARLSHIQPHWATLSRIEPLFEPISSLHHCSRLAQLGLPSPALLRKSLKIPEKKSTTRCPLGKQRSQDVPDGTNFTRGTFHSPSKTKILHKASVPLWHGRMTLLPDILPRSLRLWMEYPLQDGCNLCFQTGGLTKTTTPTCCCHHNYPSANSIRRHNKCTPLPAWATNSTCTIFGAQKKYS